MLENVIGFVSKLRVSEPQNGRPLGQPAPNTARVSSREIRELFADVFETQPE